jgi:hypothetical protein
MYIFQPIDKPSQQIQIPQGAGLRLPPAQQHPRRRLLRLFYHQVSGKGDSPPIVVNPGSGPAEQIRGLP